MHFIWKTFKLHCTMLRIIQEQFFMNAVVFKSWNRVWMGFGIRLMTGVGNWVKKYTFGGIPKCTSCKLAIGQHHCKPSCKLSLEKPINIQGEFATLLKMGVSPVIVYLLSSTPAKYHQWIVTGSLPTSDHHEYLSVPLPNILAFTSFTTLSMYKLNSHGDITHLGFSPTIILLETC